VSSRSAKHRKQKRTSARPHSSARHRKPSPIATALQNHPTRAAAAVTGAVLIAAGTPALTDWAAGSVGIGQAAVLNKSSGAGLGLHVSPSGNTPASGRSASGRTASGHQPHHDQAGTSAHQSTDSSSGTTTSGRRHRHHEHATSASYADPLRAISGLIPERIDQGVDFGGSGPIYAIGDAVITNASGDNWGWPGGGWITYRLTGGPAAGLTVFVAEDVRPTVSVGATVTSNTVIANMFNGGAGIETGWAMASGVTAESQLPEAGSISGAGPFPTQVGLNFEELLQALDVPAANNRSDYPYGLLPSGYPTDWPKALGS
jgi:hypothetical protein